MSGVVLFIVGVVVASIGVIYGLACVSYANNVLAKAEEMKRTCNEIMDMIEGYYEPYE